jgi:Toastrack DUF4097
MPRHRPFLLMLAASAVMAAGAVTVFGQSQNASSNDEWCREASSGQRNEVFCEVREFTLAKPSVLRIADNPNGSIRITGTGRNDVLVRARVMATADSVDEARAIVRDVRVTTDGGAVRTDGPTARDRRAWWVSFRAEVPGAQDLDLETSNGSIDISSVRGRISAESSNGSLRMTDLGGDVTGRTTNGSVHVALAGTTWNGSGLDVRTSNGSVRLEIPNDYNGQLSVGTHNGSLSFAMPITIQGRIDRRIDTTLGKGGAPIRAETSNGSVRIERR